MTSHFRVMDHVVTSVLNDPQMTLSTARLKDIIKGIPHRYVWLWYVSIVSPSTKCTKFVICFILRPAILWQVHWMTLNDLGHYKVKDTPICITAFDLRHKFSLWFAHPKVFALVHFSIGHIAQFQYFFQFSLFFSNFKILSENNHRKHL